MNQSWKVSFGTSISDFEPGVKSSKALYGLPLEVKYCKQCTMTNQKPSSEKEYNHNRNTKKHTLDFNEDGVCSACRNNEAKKSIVNWAEREKELMDLCDRYRSKDGSYDCIVPGSGGKDSFFQSHVLKYKYGMNPLTVTWAPHIYTDWGWKNFQAWIHSGFDNYLLTPNGRTHRLLTRLAMETLFHPFQPFMLGQMYFGPKIAAKLGIPLVFYGENAAEYGNPIEENSKAEKDWSYFTSQADSEIYLAGVSIADLKGRFKLTHGDLEPYMPADPNELDRQEVRVHYLGYYLQWHPQANYYYAVEHGGFQAAPERTPGTYSKYNSIDDKVDDFHYYTTHVKFGIGRASYETSQEIRNGEIDLEEGIALVKKYDGEFPERFTDEIFKYLSINPKEFPEASRQFDAPQMTRQSFEELTDSFRSPHLWMKTGQGWALRHTRQ